MVCACIPANRNQLTSVSDVTADRCRKMDSNVQRPISPTQLNAATLIELQSTNG